MAEAKMRFAWEQTAELIAVGVNPYRKRKEPYAGRDFNPFARPRDEVIRGDITCLKAFVKGKR